MFIHSRLPSKRTDLRRIGRYVRHDVIGFLRQSCVDRYLEPAGRLPHLWRHQAIAWRVDSFSVEAVHLT